MAVARFFNVMRDIVGTGEVALPPSCTHVKAAIDHLVAAYPAIEKKLFRSDHSKLSQGVMVLLDGKKIPVNSMDITPLPPDAELSFFEIIGGG